MISYVYIRTQGTGIILSQKKNLPYRFLGLLKCLIEQNAYF